MPDRTSNRGHSRILPGESHRSANPQVVGTQRHRLPKLIVPGWQDWGVGSRYAGGKVGGLPRTRRRSIHASRNLSRAPSASLRDRLRRPRTEPVCRQVRQQSGSGEGSGQGRARLLVAGRSNGGDEHQGTTVPGACHARWNGRDPQARNRFCKPICKPDAAGQLETGETWKDRVDFAAQVGRGQRGDQRLPETPETPVVWLITQRSRVQIPPPLPRLEGGSQTENRPLACRLCTVRCPATSGAPAGYRLLSFHRGNYSFLYGK